MFYRRVFPFWALRFTNFYMYEIYLKMAQTCCDGDRVTWPDIHSNFKMAQIFFPFRFGPFWGLNFKMAQTSKWPKMKGKHQVTWPYLCHISFGPFWGISRIQKRSTSSFNRKSNGFQRWCVALNQTMKTNLALLHLPWSAIKSSLRTPYIGKPKRKITWVFG